MTLLEQPSILTSEIAVFMRVSTSSKGVHEVRMIRKTSFLLPLILACLGAYSAAQNWSQVLSSARAIDWTKAGAGTIPTNRTQCGATIGAYNGSATTINNAIAACGANQYVQLGAGNFTLSTGIVIDKDNVSLRGMGPDQTIIFSTADDSAGPCHGIHGAICIMNSQGTDSEARNNQTSWTAGYAKGSTVLTLASVSNLKVGSMLNADQLSETNDTSNPAPVCLGTPTCSQSGSTGQQRAQYQAFLVTACGTSTFGAACTSNNVTVTPPVYMPNWRSSQSPQVYYASSLPRTGVGVENLSIEVGTGDNDQDITFFNAVNSWLQNVRSIRPVQKHVRLGWDMFITIRDSYFFSNQDHDNPGGAQHDSYAISCAHSSALLVENNVFHWITSPMVNENCSGNVFGYNFSINDQYGLGDWMQGSSYNHDGGSSFFLWEANDGAGLTLDNYFGQAHFVTSFRNRWAGWEPQNAGLDNQTVAAHIYARNRFANMIGNVLGTGGYHTHYDDVATGPTSKSGSDCTHTVYAIGLGSNCANGGSSPFPTNDVRTPTSLMRWGNYDTVNQANRFFSSEVPTTDPDYPNTVPSSQNLPASFYLSAKPSWWGTMPWPAIGPDVTGGDVTGSGKSVNAGLNGHVYRIPARVCFEDVMGGTFNTFTALTFNANDCYSGSGSNRPDPPTGLAATVN